MCESVVMRTDVEIQLAPEDRVRLEKLVAARKTPQKHVCRAQIVLLSADQDAIAVIAPQSEWPQITMSATPSAMTAYSIVADTPPGSGP
jgi:hypothetical protein